MNLEKLGNDLVKCSLNCEGITNDPTRGIIPRSLIKQERNGKNAVIVVGLNPGKCNKQEQDYYLKNGFFYKSLQNYFFETNLHNRPYFKRTRDLITSLGFYGNILWTDLVKCERFSKNGVLPIQTLRVCINKYLKNEIELFKAPVIFTLGNLAFDFCALSFPNHFVVGIPHPTGPYINKVFSELKSKIEKNSAFYKKELLNKRDSNQNIRAIKLSELIAPGN